MNDRVAGNTAAIQYVNNTLPPSKQRDVIKLFSEDTFRLVGTPRSNTQTEFEHAADALLKGKTGAETKLFADSAKLLQRLTDLEQQLTKARADEQARHDADIEKIRADAEAHQSRLVSLIFFGGSVLGAIAGVVVLTTAAHVPFFGPRAAFGCFGFAFLSGFMGVVLIQLMDQIRAHPWVLWIGLLALVAVVGTVVGVMYANYHHHKENASE